MTRQYHTEIDADLKCGTRVYLIQREPGMIFEFEVTPPPGITIEDSANVKDGKLYVRMTRESMVGLFQLFYMVLFPGYKRRKKFLGIF